MDKYCGYCGKELVPGEGCGCRGVQPSPAQPASEVEYPPTAQHTYIAAGEAPPVPQKQPSPLGKFFKGYFADPGAASDELLREGGKSPYLVGLISVAVCGLYMALLCRQLISALSAFAMKSLSAYNAGYASYSAYRANPAYSVYAIFGEIFDDIDWMLDRYFDLSVTQFFSELQLPYGGLLLTGIAAAAVGILLVALVWILLGSVAKRSIGYGESLRAVCAASHAATVIMALAILMLFFSFHYSLLCVLAAVITFAVSSGLSLHSRVGGGAKIQYLYGLLFFVGAYLGYLVLNNLLARQILNISFRGYSLGMMGSDPFWLLNLLF